MPGRKSNASPCITLQMAFQRYWVSSDSKCGLKPKGSRKSACRYPLSPRALRDAGNSSSKAEAERRPQGHRATRGAHRARGNGARRTPRTPRPDSPVRELAGINSQHRLAVLDWLNTRRISRLVGIPRDGAKEAFASAPGPTGA